MDSVLIIYSEFVTLRGEIWEMNREGNVQHMHLVYVVTQLVVGEILGEEGKASRENKEKKKTGEVTQLALCRGQFPARRGKVFLRRTGS